MASILCASVARYRLRLAIGVGLSVVCHFALMLTLDKYLIMPLATIQSTDELTIQAFVLNDQATSPAQSKPATDAPTLELLDITSATESTEPGVALPDSFQGPLTRKVPPIANQHDVSQKKRDSASSKPQSLMAPEQLAEVTKPVPSNKITHNPSKGSVEKIPTKSKRQGFTADKLPQNTDETALAGVQSTNQTMASLAEPEFRVIPDRSNSPPIYPLLARKRGYIGTVILKVTVSASGQVLAVKLQESSGHQILDKVAIKTVSTWGFSVVQGARVENDVLVPVEFQLEGVSSGS